ncbi:MAG: UTP--glucose-1-phosphate uridylyltransferase [Myxococcales bacterium]|nr:UTP--glucose-1-phosphate uridylyltransferase [Myxococcales bacterium]
MGAAGLPSVAIETFRHYYDQLARGITGLIPESEIAPVAALPDAEALGDHRAAGVRALDATVVIKLNGGLGTSMGMTRAKSLLPVKGDRCFLDVVAEQTLALRRRHECRLPLVLMNSFRTREDSLAALARHEGLAGDLPADFLQHKVPRIRVDDLSPVAWPADPEAEWCPPGHGDLYTALATSGMLEALLEGGYRHAFVSNADNLGAVLDLDVLGWFADRDLPFLMEVADRTLADRKGGHLARRADGGLLLRESAQCPEEDAEAFQDVGRHRYFNTNSLWLDLRALSETLASRGGVLGLPMIRNEKRVDPGDPSSPRVYQLETAMGAAIAVFEEAQAIRVPRSRFAPVKTTSDLLVVRSDAYALSDDAELLPALPHGAPLPRVELDDAFYKTIADFDARFPHGPPSLARCTRLRVEGDVRFGAGVAVEGDVVVRAEPGTPRELPAGTLLRG